MLEGSAESRDPDAVDFLNMSGLPVSAVVLGLFDQSDDCIKLIDPQGRLRFMNCNGKQAMEIDDFTTVEGRPWESLWPDDSRDAVNEAVTHANGGKLSRFEAFCPTAKGTPRWWEVTVSPILAEDGSVAAILSSSRDITDRKLREDALSAIAAEMKHRLRNAYTVGAAVSMAMAKDYPEHKEFANRLSDRLVRLAEVQAALVDVEDIALAEIVERITRAFRGDAQEIAIGPLPKIRLDEQRAKTLILVLGELATNSLKYGALSGRGQVTLNASIVNDEMVLVWDELHCSPHEQEKSSSVRGGSGQQLMSRMLATCGGSIQSGDSDGGYSSTVTLRL